MKKRILAMLLITAMAVSMLCACGGSDSQTTAAASEAGKTEAAATEAAKTEEASADYAQITFNLQTMGGLDPADKELVIEELNKILREKCGAELVPIMTTGEITLYLTGGEGSIDLFCSAFTGLSVPTLVANGQVEALDDLIAEYGQGITELFNGYEEVLDCGRVNGKLYGIPTITAWATPLTYIVRKADCDAAGVDISTVSTLDELTEALIKIKEANPDYYYIPASSREYWYAKDVDYFGITNYLGVLTDPANNTTVENYYESETFLNLLENVKIWKEYDIMMPDPMSNEHGTLYAYMYDECRGSTGYSWSIDETLYQESIEHMWGEEETVGTELSPAYLTTGSVTTYMMHITSFCENKEAAMKILNELYTNAEAATIYLYGIEDRNYEMSDEGYAQYMEGKSYQTSGWKGGTAYYVPNSTLCPAWKGSSVDVNDKIWQANKDAIKSKALGFTPDLTSVSDQVAACSNVVSQYFIPLINGVFDDMDQALEDFNDALYAAGLSDIMAEEQKQLDAWLAQK